jgi:hypothetical protein
LNVYITSLLEQRYRDELEELLYFNPQQAQLRKGIIATVERYGSPRIVEEAGRLRIKLDRLDEVQTLYAMVRAGPVPTLAGAIVYTRAADDAFEILHIVVKQQYALSSQRAEPGVALLLVEEVAHIAHRVRGIRSVRLAYNDSFILPF